MKNSRSLQEDDDSLEAINKIVSELAKEKPQLFSHEQLKIFTSKFDDNVGSGAFGDVYRGQFPDGTQIAVKVLKNNMTGGVMQKRDVTKEQFMAEVSTMGRTYHQNLIKLYGFCFDANMKALVYEYMEKGSLDKILYKNHHSVEWLHLYDIATNTAKGLSYLHENCNPKIIHHDIKAANVLLDANLSPKVTDFGLAKLCNLNVSQVAQSGFRGTEGYAAPEVCMGARVITYKCDVYSFGMMLFEILRRKKNHDGQDWFPGQFWEYFVDGQLDKVLTNCGIAESNKEKAKRLSMVALMCSQGNPQERPSMSTVVKMLEGYIEPQPPTINPFPYYDSSSGESSLSSGPRRTRTLPTLAASDKSLQEKTIGGREENSNHKEFVSSSSTPDLQSINPVDLKRNIVNIGSGESSSDVKASIQNELNERFKKDYLSPHFTSTQTSELTGKELKESSKPQPSRTSKARESEMRLKQFGKICPHGGEKSVILYTTSMGAIKRTTEECNMVRSTLQFYKIQIIERDTWVEPDYAVELRELLGENMRVPALFVKGRFIGGGEKVMQMEKDGELEILFEGIRKASQA